MRVAQIQKEKKFDRIRSGEENAKLLGLSLLPLRFLQHIICIIDDVKADELIRSEGNSH